MHAINIYISVSKEIDIIVKEIRLPEFIGCLLLFLPSATDVTNYCFFLHLPLLQLKGVTAIVEEQRTSMLGSHG